MKTHIFKQKFEKKIKITEKPYVFGGPTIPTPPTPSSAPLGPMITSEDMDDKDILRNEKELSDDHDMTTMKQSTSSSSSTSTSDTNQPFYPTIDGRPPKIPQENQIDEHPNDNKKHQSIGPFIHHPGNSDSGKFEFSTFENEHLHPQQRPPPGQNSVGPGYFNPSASKSQFDFNPYTQGPLQHPLDKSFPPELFNILGGNNQNLPPHVRLEHLLQHIQGQDIQGPITHGQNYPIPPYQVQVNGVNYPYGGDHHIPENGLASRPTG